jgi:hypothetical protein
MSGFLNRWSKRKAGLETDEPVVEEKNKVKGPDLSKQEIAASVSSVQNPSIKGEPVDLDGANPESGTVALPEQSAVPTLEDVLKLTKDSDYSAYVQSGIDPNVQQAALNKLFSDPHYNIMDGLDIYIDDYNKPDPIPLEMLKKLNQSHMLGLFKTSEEKESDLQAELLERKDYEERLAKLDADEAAVSSALTAVEEPPEKLDDLAVTPDETSNGINVANSAELKNSQEEKMTIKSDQLSDKT